MNEINQDLELLNTKLKAESIALKIAHVMNAATYCAIPTALLTVLAGGVTENKSFLCLAAASCLTFVVGALDLNRVKRIEGSLQHHTYQKSYIEASLALINSDIFNTQTEVPSVEG